METEKDKAGKKILDAYKKVRKPAAPPKRVIPDKRKKIMEREADTEIEDAGNKS